MLVLATDNGDEDSESEIHIWGYLLPKLEKLWQNHEMQNTERCISQPHLYRVFEHWSYTRFSCYLITVCDDSSSDGKIWKNFNII